MPTDTDLRPQVKPTWGIVWRSKITGHVGSGTHPFAATRSGAEVECARLDREYPDLEHTPICMGEHTP